MRHLSFIFRYSVSQQRIFVLVTSFLSVNPMLKTTQTRPEQLQLRSRNGSSQIRMWWRVTFALLLEMCHFLIVWVYTIPGPIKRRQTISGIVLLVSLCSLISKLRLRLSNQFCLYAALTRGLMPRSIQTCWSMLRGPASTSHRVRRRSHLTWTFQGFGCVNNWLPLG